MNEKKLRELVEKWRDRANAEEYKLHREWAIDQCANANWRPHSLRSQLAPTNQVG